MVGEFIFHNVGHGLFYSGQIKNDINEELNFIFDCGTFQFPHENLKILHNKIDKYVEKNKIKELNMLFISHLHSDHINGIPYLLKKIKCKRVFMPYFTPIERLFFIAEYFDEPNEVDGKKVNNNINDIDNGIIEFIKSPHNYFLDKDVEVIYINDNPSERDSFNDIAIKGITFIEGNRIYLEDSFNPFWDFILYNRKSDVERINEFKRCVLNNLGIENFCYSDLENILKEKKKLDEIRKIHSNVFEGKFNDYGLMLIHKPVINSLNNQLFFIEITSIRHERIYKIKELLGTDYVYSCCEKLSTFLSGDRYLNVILENDNNGIESYLEDVRVFQVPHHGSDTNWDTDIINDCFNSCKCKKAVICFGRRNYGEKVKNDLENKKFELIEIKSDTEFYYKYRIKFHK